MRKRLRTEPGKGGNARRGGLRTFREVLLPSASSVGDQVWEELEMAVDSGASQTVTEKRC